MKKGLAIVFVIVFLLSSASVLGARGSLIGQLWERFVEFFYTPALTGFATASAKANVSGFFPEVVQTGGKVCIRGPPNSRVSVYDLTGREIVVTTTDYDGCAVLPMSNLRDQAYIGVLVDQKSGSFYKDYIYVSRNGSDSCSSCSDIPPSILPTPITTTTIPKNITPTTIPRNATSPPPNAYYDYLKKIYTIDPSGQECQEKCEALGRNRGILHSIYEGEFLGERYGSYLENDAGMTRTCLSGYTRVDDNCLCLNVEACDYRYDCIEGQGCVYKCNDPSRRDPQCRGKPITAMTCTEFCREVFGGAGGCVGGRFYDAPNLGSPTEDGSWCKYGFQGFNNQNMPIAAPHCGGPDTGAFCQCYKLEPMKPGERCTSNGTQPIGIGRLGPVYAYAGGVIWTDGGPMGLSTKPLTQFTISSMQRCSANTECVITLPQYECTGECINGFCGYNCRHVFVCSPRDVSNCPTPKEGCRAECLDGVCAETCPPSQGGELKYYAFAGGVHYLYIMEEGWIPEKECFTFADCPRAKEGCSYACVGGKCVEACQNLKTKPSIECPPISNCPLPPDFCSVKCEAGRCVFTCVGAPIVNETLPIIPHEKIPITPRNTTLLPYCESGPGYCEDSRGLRLAHCSSNSTLVSYSCSQGNCLPSSISCPNGCSNGACRATPVTPTTIPVPKSTTTVKPTPSTTSTTRTTSTISGECPPCPSPPPSCAYGCNMGSCVLYCYNLSIGNSLDVIQWV